MKEIIVAPSLLSGDFNNLSYDLKRMKEYGVKYLHFDVMDGHFVRNISFGAPILKSIRPHYDFVMDVHLMISDPLYYSPQFIEAGADIITFHLEAYDDREKTLQCLDLIRKSDVKCGLSIKPGTDVSQLVPYLDRIDLCLVMSVEPGWGGQEFISGSLKKISFLSDYIDGHNLSCLISVDGGINDRTGRMCVESGVDILVAGSYLFNKEDLERRLSLLRGSANEK